MNVTNRRINKGNEKNTRMMNSPGTNNEGNRLQGGRGYSQLGQREDATATPPITAPASDSTNFNNIIGYINARWTELLSQLPESANTRMWIGFAFIILLYLLLKLFFNHFWAFIIIVVPIILVQSYKKYYYNSLPQQINDDDDHHNNIQRRMERINREREESEAMASQAAQMMLDIDRNHLQEFIKEHPNASYEEWIANLHPDNVIIQNTNTTTTDDNVTGNVGTDKVMIDHRFYVQDSDHLKMWNELTSTLRENSRGG